MIAKIIGFIEITCAVLLVVFYKEYQSATFFLTFGFGLLILNKK